MQEFKIGRTGEAGMTVDKLSLASTVGSGGLDVFSTPHMIAYMEMAAINAVHGELKEGQSTVGCHVDVRHLRATGIGKNVRTRAELIAVEGNLLTFEVQAFCEEMLIGEGTHMRAIIDIERFLEKL